MEAARYEVHIITHDALFYTHRAGEKLVVTDDSDPVWWRGKLDSGREGSFPSRCVDKLKADEKVMQVNQSVQLDCNGKVIKLYRNQARYEQTPNKH